MATEHKILVQKGDTPATVKATTAASTIVAKPPEPSKPAIVQQSIATTPTETMITVKPTIEIADPFLSTRVVPPYTGTGPGESIVKPASAAASEPIEPAGTPATAPTTAIEQPIVEPQKKTAKATVGVATASGTPLQVQLPPMHFHIPTSTAEGRRDQPQPEAKPSIMMPLGSVTKEIEVTTKGMEIQVGSTLLTYYDWVRSRGYERSLSEFINQTVEAYFTEKGLVLGITFRRAS